MRKDIMMVQTVFAFFPVIARKKNGDGFCVVWLERVTRAIRVQAGVYTVQYTSLKQ